MLGHVRAMFDSLPIKDAVKRQQAAALQLIVLLSILGLLFIMATVAKEHNIPTMVVLVILLVATWIVLRLGHYTAAVAAFSIVSVIGLGLTIYQIDLNSNSIVLMGLVVPVLVAGLLGGLEVLLPTLLLSLSVAVFGAFGTTSAKPGDVSSILTIFSTVQVIIGAGAHHFGTHLRSAMTEAQVRAKSVERMRDDLTRLVDRRTAELAEQGSQLEAELIAGRNREMQLQEAFAALRASEEQVRNLQMPTIPVLPGTIIVPMTGVIAGEQANLVGRITSAIQQSRSRTVLLDLTGVALMDSIAAHSLIQGIHAAHLLGAEVILVGIRPDLAQTLVAFELGSKFVTFATLQEAILRLLATPAIMKQA